MFAPRLHANPGDHPAQTSASLDASDEWDEEPGIATGWCPPALLAEFSSHMAAQGRPVDAIMMRADREYAMWQIACARTRGDALLAELAGRLFACLDGRQAARAVHGHH